MLEVVFILLVELQIGRSLGYDAVDGKFTGVEDGQLGAACPVLKKVQRFMAGT